MKAGAVPVSEKWVSEGWSCASRDSSLGTTVVAGLIWLGTPVNTLYTFPQICSTLSEHFTLQGSADPPKVQHLYSPSSSGDCLH